MVDVEEHALRPLEQDTFAFAPGIVEERPHRFRIGEKLGRYLGKLRLKLTRLDFRLAEAAPQCIVMGKEPLDLGSEGGEVAKIVDADGAPADLVLVGRTDAAAGGADLRIAGGGLADLVELAMERQDEVALPAMRKRSRLMAMPCFASLSISAISAPRIDDDAVAMTESLPA